ncbi:MAG: hypothetical protein JSU68_10670 [Phycisphaerales bacterium]|nr:MAG: hypothetical protein JSU68_10670 [Phycisphaerales bacterium]
MALIDAGIKAPRFRAVTEANVHRTPEWYRLDEDLREAVRVVSRVLPFRTNQYVIQSLINWSRVPEDPMFQLTFPQAGMLHEEDYETIAGLMRAGASEESIGREVSRIRQELNPHPAGQLTHNVPAWDDKPMRGLQHKYRETVLFFPSHGQTCHAYCTFCFRWAQFVGVDGLKFACRDPAVLVDYLRAHPNVTDVLFTGGDPLVMNTRNLRRYVEPLLDPALDRVQNIRIGTKAPAYWPHRFVTDRDADDLLRLFEQVASSGRQLAIMAHLSHPVELSTDVAREALCRIRSTGAVVRTQGPLVRHVNNDPHVWAELWRTGVRLGVVPYYMFVERNTGAKEYFQVPLVRAWEVFQAAYQQVSGLARSVRGPCMSAFLGKVRIGGVTEMHGQRVFVLEYLQARDPTLVRRPFFARFDPQAVWFTGLVPATERDCEFFPDPGLLLGADEHHNPDRLSA